MESGEVIMLYRDGRYTRTGRKKPGARWMDIMELPKVSGYGLTEPMIAPKRRSFYLCDVRIDYEYWHRKWGCLSRLIRIEDQIWVEDDDGATLTAFLEGWTRGLDAKMRLNASDT